MRRDTGTLGPLADKATVVVIGGGPGGVSAAIALIEEARVMGLTPRVIVFEGKRFAEEQHYNQCAGVLSPPITELLECKLRIPFPHHLTRSKITGYVLHTSREEIHLDGETEPSFALRRVQFDAYMLEVARQRGVEVRTARVTDLEFHADKVTVYTENAPIHADVIVGAFGLDEGTSAIFERAVRYRPPPALSSVVTKYHPGNEAMTQFGERIHAFLPASPRIEFGAITPKGNHVTINIAGATVDSGLMDSFLASPEVRRALPGLENAGRFDSNDLRYFKGRFPRGLAHNFVGDRFVMVGDSGGLVRAFKGKGVTSSILTGLRAARVIVRNGISARAFEAYHALNRDITDDLLYGQAIRQLTITASRTGLIDVAIRAARRDTGLRRALFDAVSAHRPYRDVVRESLTLRAAQSVIRALARRRGKSGSNSIDVT